MYSSTKHSALCVPAILLLVSLTIARTPPALSGTVLDSWNAGVPGLIIRVAPVDQSHEAKYATTDSIGAFRFATLASRAYVLDVFIGKKLLHRSVVDIQAQPRLVIKIAETH